MQEVWIEHVSELLKSLEGEANGKAIHELRRSFEAGKKQARLLPQLETLYYASKDREDFKPEADPQLYQSWFTEQRFKLTSGLKSVTLVSTGDPVKLKSCLYKVFSKWNPELYVEPVFELPAGAPPGISQKQLKMALKRINNMSQDQLEKLVAQVPTDQGEIGGMSEVDLEQLMPNEKAKAKVRAIAEKVKSVKKID